MQGVIRGNGKLEVVHKTGGKSPLDCPLHNLFLGQACLLLALHHITTILTVVGILDVTKAKWPTTVLIAREFGYKRLVHVTMSWMWVFIQIAVSAFSAVSNRTTPVPLERPFGSY